MATELKFTENDKGMWEASFTSAGNPIAVEVNRKKGGLMMIHGRIEDLKDKLLHCFNRDATNKDIIAKIDVPEDVTVTITSETEVTAAKATGL